MATELEKIRGLYKKLINEEKHIFPKTGGLKAPIERGVYVIFDPKGTVLHVGKTSRAKQGLRQRLNNHLRGQSSFTKKYLKGRGAKLRAGYAFKSVIVDDARLRTLLEAYALAYLCPKHLGTGATDYPSPFKSEI